MGNILVVVENIYRNLKEKLEQTMRSVLERETLTLKMDPAGKATGKD